MDCSRCEKDSRLKKCEEENLRFHRFYSDMSFACMKARERRDHYRDLLHKLLPALKLYNRLKRLYFRFKSRSFFWRVCLSPFYVFLSLKLIILALRKKI